MSQFISALSYLLHSLATVIFIGYFLLQALLYLPVLAESQSISQGGLVLSQVSKRSRYWMYASLIIFLVTGVALMVLDVEYLGLGDFSNGWSILMLLKHLVILVMIGLGFWFNFIVRIGPMMDKSPIPDTILKRYKNYIFWMSVLGILVLLLTAISQSF
jgi:uncharacterized membrane protein